MLQQRVSGRVQSVRCNCSEIHATFTVKQAFKYQSISFASIDTLEENKVRVASVRKPIQWSLLQWSLVLTIRDKLAVMNIVARL